MGGAFCLRMASTPAMKVDRHGAHPGQKDSQLALGCGDFGPFLDHGTLSDSEVSPNEPKSCNEVGTHGNSKIAAGRSGGNDSAGSGG